MDINISDNSHKLRREHYRLFMIISLIMVVVGLALSAGGFFNHPQRTWANLLVCNYYFVSIVIGASFFLAIQSITQSGWAAMFKRIPESISAFLPLLFVSMLLMFFFGNNELYKWTDHNYMSHSHELEHKITYLSLPFFISRFIIFFGLWILLNAMLRRFSLKEDRFGGSEYFNKSEFYSKVYIFILALTFTLGSIDWIMSIDTEWGTDLFAGKNFISAFLHGAAMIFLIVIILNKLGYFPELSKHHLHDFSKYLFILSLIWGYMWFSQYFLIWFAHIPEETVYYAQRNNPEWKNVFLSSLILNWVFPFFFLFLNKIAKNIYALLFCSVVLLIGLWVDIYGQVMPGITGKNVIGLIEIGMITAFFGLFILAFTFSLYKANLIPINHLYLKESKLHKY